MSGKRKAKADAAVKGPTKTPRSQKPSTVKKETTKKATKPAPAKKETAKKPTTKKAVKTVAEPKKSTKKAESKSTEAKSKATTTKKATTKKAAEDVKKATTKKAATKKEVTPKLTTKKATAKKTEEKKATAKKATTKKTEPKETKKSAPSKKRKKSEESDVEDSEAEGSEGEGSEKKGSEKEETKAPAKKAATKKKTAKKKTIPAKPEFSGFLPVAATRQTGILLSFGSGDMAQLGLGLSEGMRERKFPTVLKSLNDVVEVSSGALHNAAITTDGQIYTWGCNDDAALGRSGDEWLPNRVDIVQNAVKVCCGSSHTLALTKSGEVFAWGTYRNAQGVMGVIGDPMWGKRKLEEGQDEEPRISRPTKESLEEVVDIACGDSINLAVTKAGAVYMWGDTGNDRRVCSRLTGSRMTPHRVMFPGHSTGRFEKVYAGGYSLFAVDASGEVWGWGPNNYNQIGVESDGDTLWVRAPKRLASLAGSPVVHMAAAIHHTICVNAKGEVYTFGRGSSGRLGHGDENDRKVPTLVAGVKGADKVINVACGEAHSVCVTENGQLFSFGNGDLNQLGNGEEGDVLTPHHVQGQQLVAAKRKVLAAGCGSQHTVIFTTVGDPSALQKPAAAQTTTATPTTTTATPTTTTAPTINVLPTPAPATIHLPAETSSSVSATPSSVPLPVAPSTLPQVKAPETNLASPASAMDIDTPREKASESDSDDLPEPDAEDLALVTA